MTTALRQAQRDTFALRQAQRDTLGRFLAGCLAAAVLMAVQMPIAARADASSVCTGSGPSAGIVTACSQLLATGKLDSDSQVVALYARGNAYEALGQHQQAITDYTAAIAIKPSDVLYFQRGYADEQLGQDTAAIADYGLSIAQNAQNLPAFTRRGFAYLRQHDYANALTDFNAALALNATAPGVLNGRGLAYVGSRQYDLAIADFTTVINAGPNEEGYRDRAEAEFNQAHWAPAAADFAQVLTLKPTDAYSLLWEHIALVRAGQADPNFATAAAALDQTSFPAVVANFYLGKLGAGNVFAQAGANQQCAAEVFVGESHEMAKQHGTAVINFQTAINPNSPICSYGTFEYQVATSEMSR